jgi:hypothetical protein
VIVVDCAVGADSRGMGSGDVELLVDDGADCKGAGAALFGTKVVLSIELLVTGTLCGAIFVISNPLPFELKAWTSGEIISSSTIACFEVGCGCRRILAVSQCHQSTLSFLLRCISARTLW